MVVRGCEVRPEVMKRLRRNRLIDCCGESVMGMG